jgi:hypothetical protein
MELKILSTVEKCPEPLYSERVAVAEWLKLFARVRSLPPHMALRIEGPHNRIEAARANINRYAKRLGITGVRVRIVGSTRLYLVLKRAEAGMRPPKFTVEPVREPTRIERLSLRNSVRG